MKTVFSGIQPTGELHLGNYLGAVRNWVSMQDQYRCFYCIVDYHALTQKLDAVDLSQRTIEMATDLLACGVDPSRSVFFVQSSVPQHTELCWILNTVAPFGELSRMTQFKDKSDRQEADVNVGLFDYPVLQAADILLYRGEGVPVGQDQLQHLEFSRELVRKFNSRWGDYFVEPEALLSSTPKILGLDGQAKMSKSLGNTISFSEDDESIRKKLMAAATDPARVRRNDKGDPKKCNVFTLHGFFSTDEQKDWAAKGCETADIGCVDCKKVLVANVTAHLVPIRKRKAALVQSGDVSNILADGAKKASAVAKKTMAEVRERLGVWQNR